MESLNGSLAGMPGIGLGIFGTVSSPERRRGLRTAGWHSAQRYAANHIYMRTNNGNVSQQPRLKGTVQSAATDIDAVAKFGIVDVGIQNGTGHVRAEVDVRLKDPGIDAHVDRISVSELFSSLRDSTTIAALTAPLTVNWLCGIWTADYGIVSGSHASVVYASQD